MGQSDYRRDPGWYRDNPYGRDEAYWDGKRWTGTTRSNQKIDDPVWMVMVKNLATATLFIVLALAILSALGLG